MVILALVVKEKEKHVADLFGNIKKIIYLYKKIIMKSQIIIGNCFGDEGKGITTDFLCRKETFGTIVVRFSGGQQAGHNVKIGKVSHVHSNFGSGTLRGVSSYFSEHCTIYPVTMLREFAILRAKIYFEPQVYYHPLAYITTPADVAYNRWREKKLGHGSCGIGVGATMKRNIETPVKVYAIDLTNIPLLLEKCHSVFYYYRDLIGIDNPELESFYEEYNQEFPYFNEAVKGLGSMAWSFLIKDYDYLKNFKNIIFEGSQGIMLDMTHGTFPNVTYANTTSKNALEICKRLNIKDIEIFYVTRCYQTRHGVGWMSNEEQIKLTNTQDEINIYNEWQKDFRIGEIDYGLLNYAYSIDNLYSKDIPKSLVVTCLDQRPGFEFEYDKLKADFKQIYNSYSADSKAFISLGSEAPLSTY
jgi:adenylosuccinate synthase